MFEEDGRDRKVRRKERKENEVYVKRIKGGGSKGELEGGRKVSLGKKEGGGGQGEGTRKDREV